MALLNNLNPFASNSDDGPKAAPIGGRMGFFDDEDFERGESLSSFKIPDFIKDAFEAAPKAILDPTVSTLKETVWALKDLTKETFPSKGSLNFQDQAKSPELQKKEKEAQYKKMFFSSMEEAKRNVQGFAHERAIEEAARLEVSAMPTIEKNKILHLNLDLSEKNIHDPYHLHELRRIKMEQIKQAQKQQQSQELAQANRGNNLLNMNAQEGQSMISSSGAILTAG